MENETLGHKLGTTTHLSPLLRKARRLGLDARGLERLAIQRGCDYYQEADEPLPSATVSERHLSNEELAVALLHSALRYHPQTLRLGAAMLGAFGNDPDRVAYLAKLERCESVVRYVAAAGSKFEPDNVFWRALLSRLPVLPPPKSSRWPARDCKKGAWPQRTHVPNSQVEQSRR